MGTYLRPRHARVIILLVFELLLIIVEIFLGYKGKKIPYEADVKFRKGYLSVAFDE
jgi:hypothetical protein